MSSKDLKLPIDVTKVTTEVIGRVYRKIGSITKCKTIEDFGRYRFVLVQEFDKAISEVQQKTYDELYDLLWYNNL